MQFQPMATRGEKQVNVDEKEWKKSECDVIRQNWTGDMDPTVLRDITVNTFHNILNNCLSANFLSYLIILL